MIGVILAAGRGARLRPLTDTIPKALISVGGRTCLDHCIACLSQSVREILVVTGYKSEMTEAHLQRASFPVPVRTVRNDAPEAGNLTSLAAARPALAGHGFILTNADHIFPADMYSARFRINGFLSVAAEKGRAVQEDEMKIQVKGAQLSAISKTLTDFDGAYIGTTIIPKASTDQYWRAFDAVRQRADPATASVELVLHELAQSADTAPHVEWLDGLRWFEVDTRQDLENAQAGLAT